MVVFVCATAAPPLPRARRRIGGHKKWPPPFVLPHMGLLMAPQCRQCGLIAADDHVPERDGIETAATWQPSQRAGARVAMELRHPGNEPVLAAERKHHGPCKQADQRVRRRPRIRDDPKPGAAPSRHWPPSLTAQRVAYSRRAARTNRPRCRRRRWFPRSRPRPPWPARP